MRRTNRTKSANFQFTIINLIRWFWVFVSCIHIQSKYIFRPNYHGLNLKVDECSWCICGWGVDNDAIRWRLNGKQCALWCHWNKSLTLLTRSHEIWTMNNTEKLTDKRIFHRCKILLMAIPSLRWQQQRQQRIIFPMEYAKIGSNECTIWLLNCHKNWIFVRSWSMVHWYMVYALLFARIINIYYTILLFS